MTWRDGLVHSIRYYRNWKYKNLALLAASLLLLWYVADHPVVVSAMDGATLLGYFGAFIAGMFLVSIFAVAPAHGRAMPLG